MRETVYFLAFDWLQVSFTEDAYVFVQVEKEQVRGGLSIKHTLALRIAFVSLDFDIIECSLEARFCKTVFGFQLIRCYSRIVGVKKPRFQC